MKVNHILWFSGVKVIVESTGYGFVIYRGSHDIIYRSPGAGDKDVAWSHRVLFPDVPGKFFQWNVTHTGYNPMTDSDIIS